MSSFVTMEGDQNDGRSYQVVHYYVDIYTATNAGVKYRGIPLDARHGGFGT